MLTVNTHEAKTKLSALLSTVDEQGETVIICRNGHPIAELRACRTSHRKTLPPVSKKLVPKIEYDATETAGEDEWPEAHQ
ncbi:MAG: type II toxin-antitoxin system Phd/YefM family antitoxin [Candidatus Pacebacteria bacterium]|nr:type II toxin-antitoxin system Phd/YefM family antitoxin [Candidatus Paceibacterota bacterium]